MPSSLTAFRLTLCAALACGACSAPVGPADAGTLGDGSPALDGAAPPADAAVPHDADVTIDASGHADAGPVECPPAPSCDAPPPEYGPLADWNHSFGSPFTTSQGAARHRGRDLWLRPTDPQWALAKLAYGPADDDLEDEEVDIYLLRDCRTWEHLGAATSTDDGATPHATVERIEDDGGRIYFRIPDDRRLGPGRHRIHFVVRGDHTSADQYVHVLEPGVQVVVSDVDGTLTESETAEFATVLSGPSPVVNAGAPEALWALADAGYQIFYVTARPDWLTTRTHEWTDEVGLPPGLVHTTLGGTGAFGSAAVAFKTEELAELSDRLGGPPALAFGNKESDAAAYLDAGVDPTRRYLYQLDGDAMGGVHFDDYGALVSTFEDLPRVCR